MALGQPQKGRGVLCEDEQVRYAFTGWPRATEQQLNDYPITKACSALSVTASGFHAWKDRPDAQRTLDAQRLLFQIKTLFNQWP